MTEAERDACVLPLEALMPGMPRLQLDAAQTSASRKGSGWAWTPGCRTAGSACMARRDLSGWGCCKAAASRRNGCCPAWQNRLPRLVWRKILG